MQSLSAKGCERGSGVVAELASLGFEAAAVDAVAEERMPDRGEVDADLMRAPGFEPAGDEARHRRAIAAAVAFEHLPMGDRRPPAGAHRHLVADARMAADRLVDGAARPLRCAPYERQVPAPQRPAAAVVGELAAERAMGAVGLGHHDEAAGVLIEAMHDAGALDAADAGEAFAAMGDERIDQGAGPVAGGGVDDEPRRLVDD